MNVVVLQGRLPRPSSWRTLPSGDELAELDVSARSAAGAETVNVVWPSAPAGTVVDAGAEVVVVGRVRRRFFRSGGATLSKTEVIADAVIPSRQAKKAAAAIDAALAAIAEERAVRPG